VRRDGLLDVLKERRFRQTLLCRADRRPDPEPSPERLTGMSVSGALRSTADEASGRVTFLGPGTAHVVSDHPLVVRTLRAIGESWPAPLAIADLGQERELPAIQDILLRCYATNLVRLHVDPPTVSTMPPERPCVSPVARLEAAEGTMVTTVRHTHLELDDGVVRQVTTLLDGSRDRAALAEAIGDPAAVDAALARLAGAGMLLP
jgi:hypothetical protein